MSFFRLSCPLIPLLPDGEGYPDGYCLPKRQRNADALDMAQLTRIFRESLIFETSQQVSDSEKSNLCVLTVLSPYSPLSHVMITELNPTRFLPGPESFKNDEWSNLAKLAIDVIDNIDVLTKQSHDQHLDSYTICCGFNWSPYSWGFFEEKGGCQSIATKFHLMIWQWPLIEQNDNFSMAELPKKHQFIFFDNAYNAPFARLVAKELNLSVFECGPRGLFVPFEVINVEMIMTIKSISEKVQLVIHKLNSILIANYTEALNSITALMKQTEKRVISEDEINRILRYNHLELNSFDKCISLCQNEDEKIIIKSIYDAVSNRVEMNTNHNIENFMDKDIWEKFFGFSLVLADTKKLNDNTSCNAIQTGLYIGLHPLCGPGGCAELLGCYLTRPEVCLADEQVMVDHNHQIWKLQAALNCKK